MLTCISADVKLILNRLLNFIQSDMRITLTFIRKHFCSSSIGEKYILESFLFFNLIPGSHSKFNKWVQTQEPVHELGRLTSLRFNLLHLDS